MSIAQNTHQVKLKPNILYVDDEEMNLKVFKSTFKRHYNIFTCTSGHAALEILKSENIQLIVTDQRMPEMNGTELLSQVVPNHPNILRMIMTGFSDLEVIIRAVNEFGIHQYITKPWDFEALKTVFDNLLLAPNIPQHEPHPERNQIAKYAEGFINKRSEEGFDKIKKFFNGAYFFNHSASCRGEKNVFMHEFKKGEAVIACIVGSSVTGIRGSMLKSFVSDMAKEQLLSRSAFNPVSFFRHLTSASEGFLNEIEIEWEEIEIQMVYKSVSKPSTWVLSNHGRVLGLKDGRYHALPVHSANPDERLTIFRLDSAICDQFYLYTIDEPIKDQVLHARIEQRIIELNTNDDQEIVRIELQSYLEHEVSTHQIDKLTLLELTL
ncbi:MAG: response regulator [Bacteroidota bacterium]